MSGKAAHQEILGVILVCKHLRIRRTLGPFRPLLFALFGVVGVVRRRGLPLPRPLGLPCWGGLPLLILSPRWGGASFLPPPRSRERRASQTRQMTSSPRYGTLSSPGGLILL